VALLTVLIQIEPFVQDPVGLLVERVTLVLGCCASAAMDATIKSRTRIFFSSQQNDRRFMSNVGRRRPPNSL
jgi:hypothetical protein